jgi:hypothetical protein
MKKALLVILLILLLLAPTYFSEDSTTNNTGTTTTTNITPQERLHAVVDCNVIEINSINRVACNMVNGVITHPTLNSNLEELACRQIMVHPLRAHVLCVNSYGYLFFKSDINQDLTSITTPDVNGDSDPTDVNDDSSRTSIYDATDTNDGSNVTDNNNQTTSNDSNTTPDLTNIPDSNTVLSTNVYDQNTVGGTNNYPGNFPRHFAENGCVRRYHQGRHVLVCADENGEKTAITKTDVNKIVACKNIDVNGEQQRICHTINNEIVETKTNAGDVNEIRRCSSVESGDGNRSILCENRDGELITPKKENLPKDAEVFEDRVRYDISSEEKEIEIDENRQANVIEQNRAKLSEKLNATKLNNFKKAVDEKKFKIKRELKIQKIISEKEEFKSNFKSTVTNDSSQTLTSVSVIEVIPKEVALSAYEIKSDLNFIIIDDDPVIEFIIPSLGPGEEAEVAYFVEKEVNENVIDDIESAISFSAALSEEDCIINTANAESFDLVFDIQDDFTSNIEVSLSIPYSEACIELKNILKENYSDINCNDAILVTQDALLESIGLFTYGDRGCSASFASDKLKLVFQTKTDMLVHPLLGGSSEITFHEWDMLETNAASSLTIRLPDSAELTSFYPRSDPKGIADFDKKEIYWSPIPSKEKMPSIKYSGVKTGDDVELSQTLIYGLIILVTIIAIVAVAGVMFVKNSKKNAKRNELKLLVKKMKQIEHNYLLGKIDETTYRRLMEQYHMQRNDLEVQLFSQKPKKPKVNND